MLPHPWALQWGCAIQLSQMGNGEQYCDNLTDQPYPEPRGKACSLSEKKNTHKAVAEWERPSRTDEVPPSTRQPGMLPGEVGNPADRESRDSNTETQRFLGEWEAESFLVR